MRQPADMTVIMGETAQFQVEASGGAFPYAYRWQMRTGETGAWTDVAGTQEAVLSLTATHDMDGLQVRCIVTDGNFDQIVSAAATLRVTQLPLNRRPKYARPVGADGDAVAGAGGAVAQAEEPSPHERNVSKLLCVAVLKRQRLARLDGKPAQPPPAVFQECRQRATFGADSRSLNRHGRLAGPSARFAPLRVALSPSVTRGLQDTCFPPVPKALATPLL